MKHFGAFLGLIEWPFGAQGARHLGPFSTKVPGTFGGPIEAAWPGCPSFKRRPEHAAPSAGEGEA